MAATDESSTSSSLPGNTRVATAILAVLAAAGGELPRRQIHEPVTARFPELTPEQLARNTPKSGNSWTNRINWSHELLAEAGFLDRGRRGVWTLTDAGKRAAASPDPAALLRTARRSRAQTRRGRRASNSAVSWWVNQGDRWQAESSGGYLSAPVSRANGRKLRHWTNVSRLKVGDLILHYAAGAIRAVGKVSGEPSILEPVAPATVGTHRANVTYDFLETPIPSGEIPKTIQRLPESPFAANGYPKEQYLMAISPAFASAVANTFRSVLPSVFTDGFPESPSDGEGDIPLVTNEGITVLAKRTFTPQATIDEMVWLLRTKKQLILEGPPGSGKTFMADLLARTITGNPLDGETDESMAMVQFHQSYSYEDFVEGIRPETNTSGSLEYHVRPGIFKRLTEAARADTQRNYVIVIDEINRGNLSRVFGELLLLLEYRGMQASLPYGSPNSPKFQIPRNLYLIGTMNTADRSLAQIDYALRRRFYFHRLSTVVAGKAPVLEAWLSQQPLTENERLRVLALFIALNDKVHAIIGKDFEIGHSYLMGGGIGSEEDLRRIWQHAILPLLEEYLYNRRDRDQLLQQFSYDRIAQPSLPAPASVLGGLSTAEDDDDTR